MVFTPGRLRLQPDMRIRFRSIHFRWVDRRDNYWIDAATQSPPESPRGITSLVSNEKLHGEGRLVWGRVTRDLAAALSGHDKYIAWMYAAEHAIEDEDLPGEPWEVARNGLCNESR